MNSKKQTYRHCHTKVYYDAIIQHVEVGAEEVKDWPVSEKFIHEKQTVISEKVCCSSYTNRCFQSFIPVEQITLFLLFDTLLKC
jgi:hypothetical protein